MKRMCKMGMMAVAALVLSTAGMSLAETPPAFVLGGTVSIAANGTAGTNSVPTMGKSLQAAAVKSVMFTITGGSLTNGTVSIVATDGGVDRTLLSLTTTGLVSSASVRSDLSADVYTGKLSARASRTNTNDTFSAVWTAIAR